RKRRAGASTTSSPRAIRNGACARCSASEPPLIPPLTLPAAPRDKARIFQHFGDAFMQVDQVSVPLPRDEAYALVDAVMERDDLALAASAHEDEDENLWVFEATCESPPDLDGFSALARAVLGRDVAFAVAPVDPAVNWVARSLEGLAPVIAGRFFIHGSHET